MATNRRQQIQLSLDEPFYMTSYGKAQKVADTLDGDDLLIRHSERLA